MSRKFDPIVKGFPHMIHGADYNPDQWLPYDPDIIDKDMALLRQAHMNSLSVGIFAWAALEPEEGVYDLAFLDQAMDKLAAAGGVAVLATPSGARPQWMAEKYPEVLRCGPDGRRNGFSERHNHCYTSPVYRQKAAAINEVLALRYKDHPALGVWHISNEFGGECYCPLCAAAFRNWLKEKYHNSLDELNHQYWTGFWAHTYTSWDQVVPPGPGPVCEPGVHGLNLDWKRFVSHQTTEFLKAETEPLRRITPNVPITTNMMEYFQGLDYRVLAKELDVASWDDYPSWTNNENDVDTAAARSLWHDVIRGLKKRPFMLMESTPSMVNWKPIDKLKRPGVHRQASLLAVAHGSDTVQYFQFRKSRNCTEQYHGAVVDHVGHGNTRVFREVADLGRALEKMDAIVGTDNPAQVAFVYDWDNSWAISEIKYFNGPDKKLHETHLAHYKAFWSRGINVDYIGREDDFAPYKLLVLPMQYVVTGALEQKLADYVAAGGTVVATYMLGMANENNLTHLGGWPVGRLKDVLGVWNEEVSCMLPGETVRVDSGCAAFDAVDYCEVIHANGAQVLATYGQDYFAGMPAATCNSYGSGKAYYIAFRDTGDFVDGLYGQIVKELDIASPFGKLPQGVTAAVREDGQAQYIFLHNFALSERTVSNAHPLQDVEASELLAGDIPLPPQSVRVLKKIK